MGGPKSAASDLEARIDSLYQHPLAQFTAARNALAKTLTGADATRVKQLAKPALVPWTINQVFWSARSVYERLLEAGLALRRAQIAAIELRGAAKARERLRDRSVAHQRAVADAVHQGLRLAAATGARPPMDALTRMLEALSLAPEHPGHRGRLLTIAEPTGFGVFAGVVAPPTAVRLPGTAKARDGGAGAAVAAREAERHAAEQARREQLSAEAARAVEDARQVEVRLREALTHAEQAQREAERELGRVSARTEDARRALREAERAHVLAQHALKAFS